LRLEATPTDEDADVAEGVDGAADGDGAGGSDADADGAE
jgi:hypothetical protein